ncbi:MAG: O-antigen ligase family protein [Actinomycetota bacterium]|nr:O-antigen ligase family protein [Actinomycetota bacterium]
MGATFSRMERWGRATLVAGLALACGGVPLAMARLGGSPFGPVKAVVLSLATVMIGLGLALSAQSSASLSRIARRSTLAWAALALVGVACLSAVTAIEPHQAILGSYPDYRGLALVIACLVSGAGAAALAFGEVGLRVVSRATVAAGLLVGLAALVERVDTGSSLPDWQMLRIASTLGNPSNLGVYCVIALPLVLFVVLRDARRFWRILAVVTFGLLGLALLWSSSRGAWIGLVAAIGTLVLVVAMGRARGGGARKLVRVGLLLAVCVAVGALANPSFGERVTSVFDTKSKTARWRVSAWSSSVEMISDRPVLGWGPNSFRFVYSDYQAPKQIDGMFGYQIVEAAHNVVLDTGVAFGIPGLLALLAMTGLATTTIVREARREDADSIEVAAVGASLVGGVSGLMLHYVTMDTGPVLAAVVGLVCATQVRRIAADASDAEAGAQARWLRMAAISGAAVAFVALVLFSRVFTADLTAARAVSAAKSGVDWPVVRERVEAARRNAPFEPFFARQEGKAAALFVQKRFDVDALEDGARAYDDALVAMPDDPTLVAERANLYLAAAMSSKDARYATEALRGFERATRMDPNTGIPWAGKGSAQAALGMWEQSAVSLERAVELSPRYRVAWRNLATAYDALGMDAKAKNARFRADGVAEPTKAPQ